MHTTDAQPNSPVGFEQGSTVKLQPHRFASETEENVNSPHDIKEKRHRKGHMRLSSNNVTKNRLEGRIKPTLLFVST